MADGFSEILSAGDLNEFGQDSLSNNIYAQLAPQILGTKFNRSTWSPAESLTTSITQGLLAGFLGGKARNDVADEMRTVNSVLPSLYENPREVAAPEGVDPAAFETLKSNAIRNELSDTQRRKSLFENLGFKLAADPSAVRQLRRGNPELLERVGKESGLGEILRVSPTPTPRSDAAPSVDPVDAIVPNLSLGKESVNQRIARITNELIDGGLPEIQAASAAKEQVKGEIASNAKSFDLAKAARDNSNNLTTLASQAEAGLQQIGETGPFQEVENLISKVNPFDSNSVLTGTNILEGVAADVTKLARTPGSGATSDFEARQYLASGPQITDTTEANKFKINKMKDIARLDAEYADFLDTFREQNYGSTVGADRIWQQYKTANPLFVVDAETGQMELNSQRPSWAEFFTKVPARQALSAKSSVGRGASASWDQGEKNKVPAGMVLQVNKKTGETRLKPQ